MAALFIFALQSASAQQISIVSGNGLLLRTDWPYTSEPMVVRVTDMAGNALPEWPVVFRITAGTNNGQLAQCGTVEGGNKGTTLTSVATGNDPGGIATCWLNGFSSVPGWFSQSTITATPLTTRQTTSPAASNSVTFTMTLLSALGGAVSGVPQIVSAPQSYSGRAGERAGTPIRVYMLAGQTVPNVGVRLVVQRDPNPSDPSNPAKGTVPEATISCDAPSGIALTDQTGYVDCYPIFGGKSGSGKFNITIGGAGYPNPENFGFTGYKAGYNDHPNFRFTVSAGPPAAIRLIAGDNQPSAPPNTVLPGTLIARVEDAAGNPLPNVPVTWQVLPAGSATLSGATNTSNAQGQVQTRVQVGSIPGQGRILVSASNGQVAAEFTFSVNLVLSAFEKAGGDGQSAVIATPFAEPLAVRVIGPNGQPVAGATVRFQQDGIGDTLIETRDAVTNAQGIATTRVTAGTVIGEIHIVASLGSNSVTFTLTQRQRGPSLTPESFYAQSFFVAGSNNRGKIAPGSVITIVGPGIATGIQGYVVPTSIVGALPYQLGGVSVKFGSSWAPIYHVGNDGGKEFVTLQVPFDVTPGQVSVTVGIVGGGDTTTTVPVIETAPAIFETVMSDGKLRAVVTRPDGSYISRESPARGGETLRIYLSGLGQTSPPTASNQLGTNQDALQMPVVALNGKGEPVRVVSARYAANMIGVYEVEIEVLDEAGLTGDVALNVLTFNGGEPVYSNTSFIPFQ